MKTINFARNNQRKNEYVNANAQEGDKPWVYLLIPDTAINSSLDLTAAMRDYGCQEEGSRF